MGKTFTQIEGGLELAVDRTGPNPHLIVVLKNNRYQLDCDIRGAIPGKYSCIHESEDKEDNLGLLQLSAGVILGFRTRYWACDRCNIEDTWVVNESL